MSDLAAHMPEIAKFFWGEPNRAFSTSKELRWGTNGSRSVDVSKGTFFDHEAKKGGGVVDLIRREGHDPSAWLREHGFGQANGHAHSPGRIIATYDYTDEEDALLFQVVRKEPKAFLQRRPDKKVHAGWIWDRKGVPDVPYRLSALIEAIALGQQVFIVEGEKDVETLCSHGLVATCNAGGAEKWPASFGDFLVGADVIVLPDNDETGRKHADGVIRSLIGKAKRIRRLDLPDLPHKGDVSDWFSTGTIETFNELVAEARDAEASAEASHHTGKDFRWATAATAVGPILDGNWLIKGMIPRHGLGAFFGRPGCGKSVIATDIALHIAEGMSWREVKVTGGGVTYIASEAGKLGVNRVYAWCEKQGRTWPANFRMSPITLNMRSTEDDTRMLASDIKANQPNCVFIIIDTLARNFDGGNENAPEDMGAFVARMALLAELTGAFVCVVHHSGKEEGKGLRGHTSLIGALDFAAEAKRELGLPGILQITKLRDGQDGAEFGFAIAAIELGTDEDGDKVTAPIAVGADAEETKASLFQRPQGKNQKAITRAFEQFEADHAKPTPVGTGYPEPGKVQCVDLAAFQLFAEGKMAHKTDKERAKAVREAIEAMIAKGLLCANGGVIWRLKA